MLIRGLYTRLNNLYFYLKYKKYLPVQQRHDDVFLVSFPKSGNTWLSFLIANIMVEYLNLEIEVNFNNIHTFVPDIHLNRNIPPIREYFPFRRVIKSHSEYNSFYNNVLLLVRNPFDVMVSYYHYSSKLGYFRGSFDDFITDNRFGIETWKKHTSNWIYKPSNRVHLSLIRYEEVKIDPFKTVAKILDLWGLAMPDQKIRKAIENSDFKRMKEKENRTGSFTRKRYKGFEFVRKGEIGGATEITEKQFEFIFLKTSELLASLGYDIKSFNDYLSKKNILTF